MFSHTTLSADGMLLVHVTDNSRTTAFLRSTLRLDTKDRTIKFRDYETMDLPNRFFPKPGDQVFLALVDQDNHLRQQNRQIRIPLVGVKEPGVREPEPGVYVFTGSSTTPRRREGTEPTVRKYRVYLDHPGMPELTGSVPPFVRDAVWRMRLAWNQGARHIRRVLDETSPYTPEQIEEFVTTVIVPQIDAFNDSLGRSKDKIHYPAGMKRKDSKGDITRFPTYWKVRSFAARLGHLRDEEKPYPADLLAQVQAFVAAAGPIDYTRLNEVSKPQFARNWFDENTKVIDVRTVDENGKAHYAAPVTIEDREHNTLRFDDLFTVSARFETVLKQRKTNKLGITEGWPQVRHGDPMRDHGWTIGHYGNGEEISSEALENNEPGVRLQFGDPVPIEQTEFSHLNVVMRKQTAKQQAGRSIMDPNNKNKAKRKLRTVTLAYKDMVAYRLYKEQAASETGNMSKQQARNHTQKLLSQADRTWTFSIEQHRPLPPDSFMKGWAISKHNDGSMWLCLTIEQPAVPIAPPSRCAALHMGWRQVGQATQIATVYNPATQGYSVIRVNMERGPEEGYISSKGVHEIMLGPTRRSRRDVQFKRSLFPPNSELVKSQYGRRLIDAIRLATNHPRDYMARYRKSKKQVQQTQRFELSYSAVDTHRSLSGLQTLRDIAKDVFKTMLQELSDDPVPGWVMRASFEDLRRYAEQSTSSGVRDTFEQWSAIDQPLGQKFAFLWAKLTARVETNYYEAAHTICKAMIQDGITRLAVQDDSFKDVFEEKGQKGKKAKQDEKEVRWPSADEIRLELSQKYRQWAAPGKFQRIMLDTTKKYGIEVVRVSMRDVTVKCARCGTMNPASPDRLIECRTSACGIHDQDENAALNMARLADEAISGLPVTA